MQNLIIDGKNLGQTIGRRQNRELQRWVFLMAGGYYISVDWGSIKRFDTGGAEIEIVLYH